jgi:hypothetical protein
MSAEAMAYLDPGTGSMILQGIIAGVAVSGVVIKTYWYKLRSIFSKTPTANLLDEEEGTNDDPQNTDNNKPL